MLFILYAAIAFGILIFFHELGHFIVAKGLRIKVLKLALGFGPKILWKRVGETEYALCAVPLGGYVKMLGESPDEEVEESERCRSFSHQSIIRRFCVVFAGPAFNIFLALMISWLLFLGEVPYLTTEIKEVLPGYPAHEAGLRSGDLIVSIDGKPVHRWRDMALKIGLSAGAPLSIEYLREGQRKEVVLKPKEETVETDYGERVTVYRIGITSAQKIGVDHFGPIQAVWESVRWTTNKVIVTISGIVKLIQGKYSIKTLGGPILIGKMAGDQARIGASSYFHFIAFISVILAVMNLLPIPILDGGHLFFFLLEALIGKPVNMRVREVANYVGLFILAGIMALAIYNDLDRFVLKQKAVQEQPLKSPPSEKK